MEKFTFFWGGPFSQWFNSPFVVSREDGSLHFFCAEQYMMYSKAMLFGDAKAADRIMNAKTPRECKHLGRQVCNFDKKKWEEVARGIVYRGNYAKFRQNSELRKQLYSTIGTTLVEASPYDTIWGIGLSANDPRAKDRDKWLGTNWLGETLTVLRENMMRDEALI